MLIAGVAPRLSHDQPLPNAGVTALAVAGQREGRVAPPLAVVHLRQPGELPVPTEPAHLTALKIDLADGASARASVRERGGGVEVRIVTNSSPVAHHLSGQVDNLRRALDATGLRLNSADVSYRGEGGERHQGEAPEQTPRRDGADSEKIFTVYEADR